MCDFKTTTFPNFSKESEINNIVLFWEIKGRESCWDNCARDSSKKEKGRKGMDFSSSGRGEGGRERQVSVT